MSENKDKIIDSHVHMGIYGPYVGRDDKSRFEQPVIDALLSLKWWDWPEEKVKRNVEAISSGNVRKLLEERDNK